MIVLFCEVSGNQVLFRVYSDREMSWHLGQESEGILMPLPREGNRCVPLLAEGEENAFI